MLLLDVPNCCHYYYVFFLFFEMGVVVLPMLMLFAMSDFLDGILVQTFYTHTTESVEFKFHRATRQFLNGKELKMRTTVMRQCVQCREKENDWLPR